jgi:hypothetical protein
VVGRAVHGYLDHALDFCRATYLRFEFVRIGLIRREAGHHEYATRESFSAAGNSGVATESYEVVGLIALRGPPNWRTF